MRLALAVLVIALVGGCGERVVELDPGRDGVIDAAPDAVHADAVTCTPGPTQCSNCIDDDGDGDIDGFDIECTGSYDDDEGSFDTGVPGDNMDVTKVDCFFDGDSGSGQDGCDLHVCCILDECPAGLPGPMYDPTMCDVTQGCIDFCEPLAPPGCDCFGCCTICQDGVCDDIYTSPALAPDCDADTLGDPALCPRCHKVDTCGSPCGGDTCVLCPGQAPQDLPPTCSGATCPDGGTPCASTDQCAAGRFCAAGCCIDRID
ncbi:MAG: hypothetical protein H6709_16565 [Kofleriaceae bacterium]|nr:hypothetical protein [Myxococcales bacterium]MCB9561756.1 hypothetical protein [Kofleriaceae bacterium]MCB9573695.1 hypothetical protein [Kofleriaceae bacterium]